MIVSAVPLLFLLCLLPHPALLTQEPTQPPPPSSSTPPPTTTTTTTTTSTTTTPTPSNEASPQPSNEAPQPTTRPPPQPASSPTPPPPPSNETTSSTTTTTTTTPPLSQPRPPLRVPNMIFVTPPGRSTCPESDQIHCGTSDRCTRIRYICDGDNDCGDNTDEASSLCAVWRNNDCDRNLASCTRLGRTDCVTISNYCSLTDPPCTGTLDMRLCVMLREGKIQPLHTLELPTTTPPTTTMPTTHIPIHIIEDMWLEDFESKMSHTIRHPDCPQLYTRVGDLCMSVFFIGNMTWLESRAFCKAIGGDLFNLGSDLTAFTTLLQHLASNSVTADFWVGGRYVNDTAGWMWVDESPLTMGSPFWAVRYSEECTTRTIPYIGNKTTTANEGACYQYQQAPPANTARHCVAATYQHYYYLTDDHCFSKKSPLCVMPRGKKQAL